jgi:hypothetical protein
MASAQAAQPVKKNATKIPKAESQRTGQFYLRPVRELPADKSLPPKRSARLFSGRRCLDGTAGAGGRALLFRPSSADYVTLKVENFLFDRLSQHQDLDTGRN